MAFLTFILSPATEEWWTFALQMLLADLVIGLIVLVGHGWYKRIERRTAAEQSAASIEAGIETRKH
jgi:predicted negative regulator of RcsB-dependent stress response